MAQVDWQPLPGTAVTGALRDNLHIFVWPSLRIVAGFGCLGRSEGGRDMRLTVSVFALALVISATTALALDPALKCESSKLKTAGKYSFCRLNAESKAAKTGGMPDFSRCDDTFSFKWQRAETNGGGVCLSNGDEAALKTFITQHTDDVAAALAGGPLPDCSGDLATCAASLTSCSTTLGQCQSDLALCETQGLPATGQTISYAPGDDGETQAGEPLQYLDNGDGTVTDLNTGLMWEKKDAGGGLHDQTKMYTFCSSTNVEPCAGAALVGSIWEWLAAVNSEGGGGFAGHSDWRIPNVKELQTILDYGRSEPAVHPVFNTDCCCNCTVLTCSCTMLGVYWSSSTIDFGHEAAWSVYFHWGYISGDTKTTPTNRVRAVRGP